MRSLWLLLVLAGSVFGGVSLTVDEVDTEFSEALIDCKLEGRFLVKEMELAFFNGGKGRAEGELVCPLGEGERIVSFAMDVNGKRRSAVVVPAKRGRIAYEEIVAQKIDPGLLEVDEKKREFRTRVFPILAKEEKRVWITTVKVVDEGEVEIWPEGFGSPAKWRMTLSGEGGEMKNSEESFRELSGISSVIPGKRVRWSPAKRVVYLGGELPVRFSEFEKPEYEAGKIEIWLDGAVGISDSALRNLRELLAQYEQAELGLRVFREELGEVMRYQLKDGKCPEVMEKIKAERSRGMARPGVLPFESTEAEVVIAVTDGEFVSGPGDVGKPKGVLHVVDSGEGKSEWLRGKAKVSGGGWHGAGGLDATGKLRNRDALAVGEFEGVVLELGGAVREGEIVVESSISKWIWAFLEARRMQDEGAKKEELDRFRMKHGVQMPGYSLLVLETARQYLRYGFEPPRDDEELVAEYEIGRKRKLGRKKDFKDRVDLIEAWKKRCDLLASPIDSVDGRLLASFAEKEDYWRSVEARLDEVTGEMLENYLQAIEKGRKILNGGVEKSEVAAVKGNLNRLKKLELEMRAKIPRIKVTVGGQVRKPGRLEVERDSTLAQAVEAAGGKTPFGATNRLKLYRNGKVYVFNLKEDGHSKVKLCEGDAIEIPQTDWMGNGGSGGQTKAPFTSDGGSSIKVRTGQWEPSRPYAKILNQVLLSEGDFWGVFDLFRETYGWRPDFYLDVIELLEKRGWGAEALEVAGELAELMPGNAEVLGKAARAMRRLGRKDWAVEVFERMVELEPEGVTHRYELARTYAEMGRDEEALEIYVSELDRLSGNRETERTMVILEELNALIARTGVRPDGDFPESLIRHVPVELRAVLEWDADQANVDLVGSDPVWTKGLMGEALNFHSGSISDGYGPESFSMVGLFPGKFPVRARFYGDWKDAQSSTVTAEVEIVRNYGEENEVRERHAVRVREKEIKDLIEIDVTPREWE